jgi:hypothetical protein
MSQIAGSLATLGIDIVTRLDRLRSQFAQAEKQAADAGKRIENAVNKGGLTGITQTALKAFASFSLLEGGVKALTVASQAMRGEWEEAGELVKQLPLGIGPLAQGIEGLILSTTSWGRSITKAREEIEKTEKAIEQLGRQNELRISRQIKAQEALTEARREGSRIGRTGFELDILTLEEETGDRLQALQRQLSSAQSVKEKERLQNAIEQETINSARRRAALATSIAKNPVQSVTFGRTRRPFEAISNVGRPARDKAILLDEERNRLLKRLNETQIAIGVLN